MTFLLLWLSLLTYSQETLNAMFYNLFKFPTSLPHNRELILQEILDEYQPDLFMVCELVSENGADLILNTALQNQTDTFARAEFVPDLSKPEDPLQTMVFYNQRKLSLLQQKTLPTVYRDINQYSFQLNVVGEEPIYLEVFVAHLKSSTGTANQQMRLQMVQAVTEALEELTQPNTFVLFSGDFNFYRATEPGYQQILSLDNAIRMLDPLDAPGSWHDNAAFSYLHTQSTRVSNAGFGGGANAGASGGLDDRFDFIMMSENFQTSDQLTYVEGTYKAYGNNGDCLDKDVKDPTCTGEFSLSLREKLYNMSDHLPVVMQFQVNDNFVLGIEEMEKRQLMWFESSNISETTIKIGVDGQQLKPGDNALYIYNHLGQLVSTLAINQRNSLEIRIQHLPSGTYIITSRSSEAPLKFIKR